MMKIANLGYTPINATIYTHRHSREGGNPVLLFNMPSKFVLAVQWLINCWIPAFAGMRSSVNCEVSWSIRQSLWSAHP
jgi:hypothetical protein